MTDTDSTIQKLLSRIAALESRATAPAQPSGIDPRAIAADPVGALSRAGVPVEHVLQVLLANHLGDQAPPQLRALAAQGPLVSATQAVSAEVQAMRQRLDQLETEKRQQAMRQGFSALAVDKVKYPLLAAAYSRNPALFDADIASHQGDAAALADATEARLKALTGVTAPTASTENAGVTNQDQSQQVKQAQSQGAAVAGATVDPTPPPMPQGTKPGVFTPSDHEYLKAKILAKAQQGAYQSTRQLP